MLLLLTLLLATPPFQYPLDAPPEVSAAFGTYRIGHHHAGLDLYAGTAETVPVRAAAAGRIVRVRRSHNGYGRAIYIAHPDGRQTVYAHLSAFGPLLDRTVAEATEELSGYRFDHRLKRGVRVDAGALLGWIGTAGTDLVHLHFEVRDRGPVNPLLNGLTIPDHSPPRIRRLMVVPRKADSHVHSTHDEMFFDFVDGTLGAPVVVGGDVQLFVQATDAIDGARDTLIAAEVSLFIDDALWHHVVYDRVAYGDKQQTELDYHPRLRAAKVGVFNRLQKSVAPVRVQRRAGRSFTTLEPGDYAARIEARDAAGNVSKAGFTLRLEPALPKSAVMFGAVPPGPIEPGPAATWRDTLVIQPLPADVRQVAVRVGGKPHPARLTSLKGQPAVAFEVSRRRGQTFEIGHVGPAGEARWMAIQSVALAPEKRASVGVFELTPDKKAFFLPYPTTLQVRPAPPVDGAEILSPMFHLANGWMPTRGGTSLSVPWPEDAPPGGVGLYMIEDHKRWRVGSRVVDGRIVARTVHLGNFMILRDLDPPVIQTPRVEAHPAGLRLIVPVADALSGLRTVTLKVDGAEVLFEHQKAMKRLIYQPLLPGPHRVEVFAKDREGRKASAAFNLETSPAGASARPAERSR